MHPRLQANVLRPRIVEAHTTAPSRYVTSPSEELLRFENRERYIAQSAATVGHRHGQEVAPLPPRPRLLRLVK